MIKETFDINPFTGKQQKILDKETIAEKIHNHQISEVVGLSQILSDILQDSDISISGGYFAK